MDDFSDLYWQLDSTTKTNEKVAALESYLERAKPKDAVWAIHFMAGRRIKRLVGTKLLRQWATELTDVSDWMFNECYDRVGDLAETISLILPPSESGDSIELSDLIEQHLLPLREMDIEQQHDAVVGLWQRFDQRQLFVLGKLMMGGFRVGVSKRLVNRSISNFAKVDSATIAHRLMGEWQPDAEFYAELMNPDAGETAISKPYPFFLANPLKELPDSLGEASQWTAEWKWDGIRAQVIRRAGETFIWSRGEELVTEQFPEVAAAASGLPDGTVIDGEILGWDEAGNRPLEFSQLQRRLGRKRLGKKLLTEVPVVLLTFDLLERGGVDVRETSLIDRQSALNKIVSSLPANLDAPSDAAKESLPLFASSEKKTKGSQTTATLLVKKVSKKNAAKKKASKVSELNPGNSIEAIATAIRLPPSVKFSDWKSLAVQRELSKQMRCEGLMLKRKTSAYQVNRPAGDWWKWKVEPYTIDAVMIYAQRGHGRRASLYTDYTFAVWSDGKLVPFAKAYSGLTDKEIRKVDAFVRKNTNEKFGPVRSVRPELVFELAFENIQRSTRHKSGVAVRFPRISRWRHDKKPADADSLQTILDMLEAP